MKMVTRFNTVSYWVATEVLRSENQKKQKQTIKKFIEVVTECRKRNHFNGMMAIIAGLSQRPLVGIVEHVSEKYTKLLAHHESFMAPDANYKVYRAEVILHNFNFLMIYWFITKEISSINS